MRLTPYLTPARLPPRCRSERGFTILDTLVACCIVALGLFGYSATVLNAHRLDQAVEERTVAVETLSRFVERIRADTDWAGLYLRLKTRSQESAADADLCWQCADLDLPTYAPSSYYSDFTLPTTLGTVTVLVQVPSKLAGALPALREDEIAPRYGLPHDLNGDGIIDGQSRNVDYRALPIVVRLRWQRKGQTAQEAVLSTWLRGER